MTIEGIDLAAVKPRHIDCAPDGSLWVYGLDRRERGGLWHLIRQDAGALRVTSFQQPEILAGLQPASLTVDRRGWLWMGTGHGVIGWNGEVWRLFNRSSGLIWNDCSHGVSSEAPDGSLWLGTLGGAAHLLHPEALFGPVKVSVAINSIDRPGKPFLLPGPPFVLPWAPGPIRFGFASPETRNRNSLVFSYRIPELDSTWEQTQDSSASFTNLGPRDYHFEVIARNSELGSTSEVSKVAFRILAPWWKTNWFYGVCALAGAFFVWLLIRLRSRQLTRAFEARRLTEERAARQRAEELVEVNSQLQRNLLRLSEGGDSRELMEQLLLSAAHQLRAGGSALFLYDEGDHTVQMAASVGLESSPLASSPDTEAAPPGSEPLPAASDPLWRSFADPRETILLDARESEDESRLSGLRQQITPECPLVLLIPLAVANRLLGYLSVMFPSTLSKKDISAEQRLLAQSLASVAAISIETNRPARRAHDAALAEERNRLAHELHDTLAGAFTAISMQLQAASDLAGSNEELRKACIGRADDLASYGLRNVREFVESLTLGSANGSSLALEMRTLLLSATSGTGTNGVFSVEGQERPPGSACSQALLRVMQEALGNAQRYAEAKNILVTLRFDEDVVSVMISDDGKGFIVDQSMDKGLGLTGIQSRISRLSGRYSLTSSPGAGTKIFVELPYTESERGALSHTH